MHPQIARQLIAQHHADLAAMGRRPARLSAGRARRLALPRLAVPVWRVADRHLRAPRPPGRLASRVPPGLGDHRAVV
jgi:hypothetical protein